MKVSQSELTNMRATDQITFYALSGSTYSIFTSFLVMSAAGLLIVYNEQMRQRTIRESALREGITRAQIKVLQSELQPHFIFNTLHSVNSLMETDIEKAQDLIEQFSLLMRQYLQVTERNFYTIREEIDFLRKYVAVLQYRYAKKISFSVAIDDAYLDKLIPVILLQPIVENCIKHSSSPGDIAIEMSCTSNDKFIVLKIKDNGEDLSPEGQGVGLRNLQERLSILYESNYSYSSAFEKGYVTTVTIPAR